jgi:hypothetical protein
MLGAIADNSIVGNCCRSGFYRNRPAIAIAHTIATEGIPVQCQIIGIVFDVQTASIIAGGIVAYIVAG